MAAPIVSWICDQLSRLGIDTTEETANYILNMEDGADLEEYMYDLLDKDQPKNKRFVNELLERWKRPGMPQKSTPVPKSPQKQQNPKAPVSKEVHQSAPVPENVHVYQKFAQEEMYIPAKVKPTKGKKQNKVDSKTSHPPTLADPPEMGNNARILNGIENKISTNDLKSVESKLDGTKKKAKFVSLYSSQGKVRTEPRIPGRHVCECQAYKHKLINNCVHCGRVVCDQEGSGPCVFCGNLVCSKEELEILSRGSKRSEKLRQQLMREGEYAPSGKKMQGVNNPSDEKATDILAKAVRHKDKLLEYDRTSVRRTQVIDDESDYFSTDTNQWLSQAEREALRKREEELRDKRFGSRKDLKITLDFAGRKVIDAEEVQGNYMYDVTDEVVQEVHYGSKRVTDRNCDSGEYVTMQQELGSKVNPSLKQAAPQYVPPEGVAFSDKVKLNRPERHSADDKRLGLRLQDRELQEMSDGGWCLSMHQPWASLLVYGIKMHEGRAWYSAHRGRLWIASTAKYPTPDDINQVKSFYQHFQNDSTLSLPGDYPIGSLLGCVDVTDCLSQEEYREKYPNGESESPYVFICETPQELIVKFPIKGRHKIYKLDADIHQGAKKGLRIQAQKEAF